MNMNLVHYGHSMVTLWCTHKDHNQSTTNEISQPSSLSNQSNNNQHLDVPYPRIMGQAVSLHATLFQTFIRRQIYHVERHDNLIGKWDRAVLLNFWYVQTAIIDLNKDSRGPVQIVELFASEGRSEDCRIVLKRTNEEEVESFVIRTEEAVAFDEWIKKFYGETLFQSPLTAVDDENLLLRRWEIPDEGLNSATADV